MEDQSLSNQVASIPKPKSARRKIALALLIVGVLLFLASIICLVSLGDIEDDYDLLTFGIAGASVGFVLLIFGGFLSSGVKLRSLIKWVIIILVLISVAVLVYLLPPYIKYH